MEQLTSNPLFLGFKVVQSHWFLCKSKKLMGLPISKQ